MTAKTSPYRQTCKMLVTQVNSIAQYPGLLTRRYKTFDVDCSWIIKYSRRCHEIAKMIATPEVCFNILAS